MFETYLLPVRTAVTRFPLLALLVSLPVDPVEYRAERTCQSLPGEEPRHPRTRQFGAEAGRV